MNNNTVPILGITANSGTGKTTLLKKIIPLLLQCNIRVGLIKHTHHDIEVDIPGKDSYELRKAGACQTLVASNQRWILITEIPKQPAIDLRYLAGKLDSSSIDLILVEEFKHEPITKIALYRASAGDFIAEELDKYIIAIASDRRLPDCPLPQLDINKPVDIAEFISLWLSSQLTSGYP